MIVLSNFITTGYACFLYNRDLAKIVTISELSFSLTSSFQVSDCFIRVFLSFCNKILVLDY